MCGIVGFSGNFSKNSLDKSLDLIAHRGPDDSGIYLCNNSTIGLGHRRLSIQDLSINGRQPMLDDLDNVIIYNGEVYNFQDLRRDLIEKNYKFRSNSDTEVILNLYREYGLQMFTKMQGIFALAIWNSIKKELILARDGMGVKPLYYSISEKGFAFASEIKALAPLIKFQDLKIDVPSLNRYLSFLYCPGKGTPVIGIKKILPGEIVTVKQGKILKREVFYRLPISKSRKKNAYSLKQTVKKLDHTLRAAVHKQMISDVPVGAFLSGGLDSSSVVAYASEIDPNLQCFTIGFKDESTDGLVNDLPYAEKVAKHLGVNLHTIDVDAQVLAKGLEDMVVQLDEPIGDPAPLHVGLIAKLAKSQDIKVLLSGAGGDDIFTGYRRHSALKSDKYIRLLPNRLLSVLEKSAQKAVGDGVFIRRLKKYFNGITLDQNQRIIQYFRWISSSELMRLFSASFREELTRDYAELPVENYLNDLPPSVKTLDKMLAVDQRFFLSDHNLIYTDKMAMAHGVEVRVPLLDDKLMCFVDTIPDQQKLKYFNGKWIFKKTMEPYLPKKIIYRPKTGFGAPLRSWINFELKDLVEDLLSKESIENRGIFEYRAVAQLISRTNSNRVDGSYTILSLMCIELWFRHFLDKQPINNS